MPGPDTDAPLRVLYVCGSDFSSPSEKQVLWFANELVARGHAVMASLGGDACTAVREGADPSILVRSHRFVLRSLRGADRAAARAFAPTVIHAFNPRLAVMAAARDLQRAAGAPIVVHWEDDEWGLAAGALSGGPRIFGTRLVRRAAAMARPSAWPFATRRSLRAAAGAAAFDALTPAIAARVEERTGRACNVVLPANPPQAEGTAGGELPDALAHRELVVYTGALHPEFEADVRLGMRAVAAVRERRPQAMFVHTGKVLPRYDLDALAADEGLGQDGARFLGYVPFATVDALLRGAHVLIQPGAPTDVNRYRLPSKMQRYLASGTPTVTFATGFAELLEEGEEALKTHTAEPAELAERVLELLEDADLARRVGAGGRRAAERLFDPRANTDALIAYYRRALEVAG